MAHFRQYSCELQVALPHLALRQATEQHMQKMLYRRIGRDSWVDCLPMWYFFYANPIRDPLTLVHHANEDLELHPGTNRFIGRALRGTPDDWVPARLISIDSEPLLPLTGIRRVELEDARDFEYVNKHDFYDNTDLYRWSFGGYAPTATTWLTDCHDWSAEVLADVGGELQLSNGKRHYVNRLAPVKKRVRVTDYSGLYPAVQSLFHQLEKHRLKRAKHLRRLHKATERPPTRAEAEARARMREAPAPEKPRSGKRL